MKIIKKGLLALLLVMTLTLSITALNKISAEDVFNEPIVYKFTDQKWGDSQKGWDSGKAGGGYGNSGVQVTTGASGANATSKDSFSAVKKVVVSYCTNASSGAGSIEISVGDTKISSKNVSSTGGTTKRDLEFLSEEILSGKIKITVTCTKNSIYIIGVSIYTVVLETEEMFKKIDTNSSINLNYSEEGHSIIKADNKLVFGSNVDFSLTRNFASDLSLDENKFMFVGTKNTAATPTRIYSNTLRLYKGTNSEGGSFTLEIAADSIVQGLASLTLDFSGSLSLYINEDSNHVDLTSGKYELPEGCTKVTIQDRSSSNVTINSFSFESYEQAAGYVLNSASIRFGTTISKDVYEGLKEKDTDVEFGVLIIKNSELLGSNSLKEIIDTFVDETTSINDIIDENIIHKVNCTTSIVAVNKDGKETDVEADIVGYQYALVIENLPNYNETFYACCYAVVNGEMILNMEKSNSVRSILDTYVNNYSSFEFNESVTKSLLELLLAQIPAQN